MKPENDKKIIISVMIEANRTFESEYVIKQPVEVIIQKTVNHFNLNDADSRELKRSNGSIITNYKNKIEDVGIQDGEVLKFLRKVAPKPDPKPFA